MRAPASPATNPRGRPPAAERPDRKAAILLAAEKLFAQRGFHAVTIRQIAAEAGVPLALVGYHYGSKQELFHAIFAHWAPTLEERVARLGEVLAGAQPPALEPIVRAFVEPVLAMRASAEGEFYARLVGRELAYAADETDRVLREFFDPLAHAFIDALHAAFPRAARADAAWAYQFALGALLHHISDRRVARLSQDQNRPNDPAAAPRLIAFIAAGIRAAMTLTDSLSPQQTQETP